MAKGTILNVVWESVEHSMQYQVTVYDGAGNAIIRSRFSTHDDVQHERDTIIDGINIYYAELAEWRH